MNRYLALFVVLLLSLQIQPGISQHCQNSDKFSFVFMTDIHVQPELKADEGLLMAIKKINELNPDFVITGGDLIMDALGQTKGRADSLYQLYLKLQNEFAMPVFNTIGNHEHYAFYNRDEISRDNSDYGDKMFRRYIGLPYYSFNHNGWHFISLNSVTETEDRGYRGGISAEQVSWLEKDLASVREETPIVVSVHIPFITGMNQILSGSLTPNDLGDVINNSKEVLSLFNDKNLKLVLQGHLHYLEDLFMGGKTHFITGGAVSASWWKGPRHGMEEGFLYITVEGDEFEWKYIDFGWEVEEE